MKEIFRLKWHWIISLALGIVLPTIIGLARSMIYLDLPLKVPVVGPLGYSLLTFLIVFLPLIAILVLPIELIRMAVSRKSRRPAVAHLVGATILIFAFHYQGEIHNRLKTKALERITVNAKPLISALERYQADHGRYPPSDKSSYHISQNRPLRDSSEGLRAQPPWNVLIPKYLPAPTYSGCAGLGAYRYELEDETGQAYKLKIFTWWFVMAYEEMVYSSAKPTCDKSTPNEGLNHFYKCVDQWALFGAWP